jgi:hypothetical protein
MIAPPKSSPDAEPKVTTGFRLHPDDIEMLDHIRAHFDFDNRSQAVRKAIRIAHQHVEVVGATSTTDTFTEADGTSLVRRTTTARGRVA